MDGVSNVIDEVEDGEGKGVLVSTDDLNILGGGVEVVELGIKEFLSLGNGHTSDDEVTVGSNAELVNTVTLEEGLDTTEGLEILGQLADFLVSQVLSVLGVLGVGNFEEDLLDLVEILLADGENESDPFLWFGSFSLDPVSALACVLKDTLV